VGVLFPVFGGCTADAESHSDCSEPWERKLVVDRLSGRRTGPAVDPLVTGAQ